MPDKTTLQIIIEAVDKLSGPSAKMRKSLDELEVAAKRITQVTGLDKVGAAYTAVDRSINRVQYRARSMFSEFTRFSAMSAGVGYLLYNQFVKPAAEMERFGVQFGQLTKSSDEAKTAMSWVKDFAFRTPQSIRDTAQAFIDLRKQGIDPTKGALLAASNFAATTNRDFGEVVQSMGLAALGRARGLAKLGITANTHKDTNKVQYTIANTATGQNFNSPVIDIRNRQLQTQTIVNLLNLSYAGAAAKQMQTVEGSINRIGKMWQFFRLQVADAGVFKYVKTQVNQIADRLTTMFVSGEMQQWAQKTSDAIVGLMQRVVAEAPKILEVTTAMAKRADGMAEAFGGWGNVLQGLAYVQMFRFGVSLAGLAKQVAILGAELLALPGTLPIVAAIGTVAAALALKNSIQKGGADAFLFESTAKTFPRTVHALGSAINWGQSSVLGLADALMGANNPAMASPIAPINMSRETRDNEKGSIHIQLQSDVPMSIYRVRSDDFNPTFGTTTVSPF